jgi:hypothetical protein
VPWVWGLDGSIFGFGDYKTPQAAFESGITMSKRKLGLASEFRFKN